MALLAASAFGCAPEPRPFLQHAAANRLANTLSPLGRETWQLWNNRSLLAAVREPSGQWTTNHYDANHT